MGKNDSWSFLKKFNESLSTSLFIVFSQNMFYLIMMKKKKTTNGRDLLEFLKAFLYVRAKTGKINQNNYVLIMDKARIHKTGDIK